MLAGTLANFVDRDHRRIPAVTGRLDDYAARVEQTAGWLRERIGGAPDVAVVLGSGLGDFADTLGAPTVFPYGDIPNWPASAVVGHAGKLALGTLKGRRVAALSGRVHFYEGHDMRTVTFATRAVARLGVRTLILTNAAGGINLAFKPGTLMVMDDHINLLGANPLVGPKRRPIRSALSRHDDGVFEAAAEIWRTTPRSRAASRSRTASTSRFTVRATRRRQRFAISGRLAPTPSACRPCPKPSSPATWASRCSASPASPTRRLASCRSRSCTTK